MALTETLPLVTPATTEDIIEILNTTRERHGITSDEKPAQLLGVSDQSIYRWRRGQIDRAARIMVVLARQTAPIVSP